MPKFEILLLAAGESKRMEQSKALLDWEGEHLVVYQINKLLKLDLPVSVVLGAYSKEIEAQISSLEINTFSNPNWQEGMSTSIGFGVQELLNRKPETQAILLVLVDQPLIELADLRNLIAKFEQQPDNIWVSKSREGWTGPPAIFPKPFFSELTQLRGDDGAKPLVKKHQNSVLSHLLKSDMADMDTPEAYQELLKKATRQS